MTLRLATFNIRNGDADDGPNSWPFRKELLSEHLHSLNADLYGLQEVMDYQLRHILTTLPDYASIGVGRIDGAQEGEYAPILYRRELLRLVESGWFWLSETPEILGSKSWETACERICTWSRFELEGRTFLFMNTHLDHVSEKAQLEGVKLILERSGSGPAIVTGDFNALPDSPPIQAMLKTGFADSGVQQLGHTFHDWGTCDGGRIDYIFGRGIALSEAQIVVEQREGKDVSDHYAVVSTASWS